MYAVMGLGKTGVSVMRYLARQQLPFFACDTRAQPPELKAIQQEFPSAQLFLGELPEVQLLSAEKIILSPGLSRTHPVLQKALAKNIPIIGDIELFVRQAKAPIIAITGTNAKGTVTTMVQSILQAANLKVLIGGNFGVPVLDFLEQSVPNFYVLELSSFQLESTFSLQAAAATILNISDDHLDYHGTLENYIAAKQKIYTNAKAVVFNGADQATTPVGWIKRAQRVNPPSSDGFVEMSLNSPTNFFVIQNKNLVWNNQIILPLADLPVAGMHNASNALVASALAVAVGISLPAIQEGLKNYRGLRHRCALIATINQVKWYNDSKGTNVGATQAALAGLGPMIEGKIVMIAGGQGKGQDFSPLQNLCEQYLKALILFGQDADQLEKTLGSHSQKCVRVKSLAEAVNTAKEMASAGDVVLFSPVCASLDMFKNYEDRGEQFEALVKAAE